MFSIIGGDFTGRYQFKKGFCGLSDIPTVFQEHIDKVLEFKTPVWLDDICVTNGTIDEHKREVREVLNKLQNAGYRASEKKTEFFKQDLTWLGYHINQNGVKLIKDKTEAITKLNAPKNAKELKSFLGSIQLLSKFINNLSNKIRQNEKAVKERNLLGVDTRIRRRFREFEERNNRITMSCPHPPKEGQLCDDRRL